MGRGRRRVGLRHEPRSTAAARNRSKTARASRGPGAPSGWYWTVSIGRSRWRRPSTEPSLRLTWLTRNPLRDGSDSGDDGHLVVLGGHLHQARVEVPDGMVGAVMAEPEAAGLGAGRATHDLVAEADPQQRPAGLDRGPGEGDLRLESGRVAWTRREDQPRNVRGERLLDRGGVRQHPDPRPAPPQAAHDVLLETQVDDPDQRAAFGRVAHVVRGHRRDLPDEVLVLPALDVPGALDRGRWVDLAGGTDAAANGAGRPEVAGQRARVDTGDRRDAVASQQRGQLPGLLHHGSRGVGHDEAAQPGPAGLVVVEEPAVIADQGIGHDHELARVRRVRADLLVAGLARVDHEVATAGNGRSKGDPGEHGSVLEGQEGWPVVADARIDDRARRADGAENWEAAGRSPAPRGELTGGRGHGRRASFPASRDRYAGLTGPAIKDSAKGSMAALHGLDRLPGRAGSVVPSAAPPGTRAS